MSRTRCTTGLALFVALALPIRAQENRRVTVVYDAFGAPSALQKDWGFAALVEYGGKRILFDTGNDPGIFEHNVKQLGIELARLDGGVVSHRHGDHTSGLTYLLQVTPRGLAVVVGCSHPGVEKILAEAAKIDSRLYSVIGGFHLVLTPEAEVQRVARVLRETLKIERVAPGHCTSDLGFAVFLDRFKDRFDQAGLGRAIPLP